MDILVNRTLYMSCQAGPGIEPGPSALKASALPIELTWQTKFEVKVAVIQESKLQFQNTNHTELHHSTKGPLSRPIMCIIHLASQVDKLLSEARIPRDSVRIVDHYGQT